MFNQSLADAGDPVRADSPYVVGALRRYGTQRAIARAWIGSRNHAPSGTVPVLDQDVIRAAIGGQAIVTHRPYVICRHRRNSGQKTARFNIRSGNDAPSTAVPVFRK